MTILQELAGLYESRARERGWPEFGLSTERIGAVVVLAPAGAVRAIRSLMAPDEQGRPWPRKMPVPKAVTRTSGIKPNTFKGREIHLLLHRKGGDHPELVVRRRRKGEHRWSTDAEFKDLIRDLARYLPDELIAGLLNRLGKKTGKGNSWTKRRLCSFRSKHGIAACRKGERQERGELILSDASERLSVDPATVRRLIRSGALSARQACKGAPWIIREDALNSPEVLAGLAGRDPLTASTDQASLDFR